MEASHDNAAAKTILELRQGSNFLLATTLWGNVSINVILTLLSDSVLAGVMAFAFFRLLLSQSLERFFPRLIFPEMPCVWERYSPQC